MLQALKKEKKLEVLVSFFHFDQLWFLFFEEASGSSKICYPSAANHVWSLLFADLFETLQKPSKQ